MKPEAMTEEEWEARVELAACYRVFDLLGWTEIIYNHITLRLSGTPTTFLINPFGLTYGEIRASNLLRVDLQGRLEGRLEGQLEGPTGEPLELAPSVLAPNPAGLIAHSAFHEARADARCIMHTHTTAGMAVASSRAGLACTNFYSAQLQGKVGYHDFEGISFRPDEKARLVRDLGEHHVLILRNHGLMTVGRDVSEAFSYMWTAQRACEVQLATAALGEAIPIPLEVARKKVPFQLAEGEHAGKHPFRALVRMAERRDPSFRE
jgi:ribulose-5-phosphate 4-epimerase/fuculose-1-phosphate aldolase